MKKKTGAVEFRKMCKEVFSDCIELMTKKNDDYAKEDDAFKNLTTHAAVIKLLELDCSNRLHQPLSHIIEKVHRVANLTNKRQEPKNEAIIDSLRDIIVFANLFLGMWREDKEEYEIESLTIKVGEK